jgi:hypothetical protein
MTRGVWGGGWGKIGSGFRLAGRDDTALHGKIWLSLMPPFNVRPSARL